MTILVLTIAGDPHARLVAEALRRKGAAPLLLWCSSDFPGRATESLLMGGGEGDSSAISGPAGPLRDLAPDAVWVRRRAILPALEELHPADRAFAVSQAVEFRRNVLAGIAPDAFWVNPPGPAERADLKILQQRIAGEVGMETPCTLYSNDPDRIRAFIRAAGGAVYKTFNGRPGIWRDREREYDLYTAPIGEADLPDDDLVRAVPGIYQQYVAKAFELRVTVIGDRIFPCAVRSQETPGAEVDWRQANDRVRFEATELGGAASDQIRALMRRLGLVFGCIDLIATPDGRLVFLEVNQMGQFVFVEARAGIPLIDAFSEMLIQRRPDFAWDPARPAVRYRELTGALDQPTTADHAPLPALGFDESEATILRPQLTV